MRKSILLSAMLLVSAFAFAQIEKGQFQLGGSFGLVKQELPQGDNSNFNFVPQAGYFISDLTSIGVNLSISGNSFETPTGDVEGNLFRFGAFARFHKSVADNFYMFLQPSLGFGSGEQDNVLGGSTDINTTDIRLSPGALYFVAPKVAVELTVGSLFYSRIKQTSGANEIINDSYGLNLSLANANLGINFYL